MIRWFGLFAALVLWTTSLAEMKAQSLLPMPFSYIPISTGGTVTVDCDDIDPIYFTDDNNGGSNFQTSYTNQNHTITLCPDEPGDALALDFLVFDLETGVAASDNDVLLVYDGDNSASPLLWSAEGDALEGLTITASASNLTGCITLEFVVNSGAFGPNEGWVARVRCGLPCAYPEAAVEAADLNPLPGPGGAVGLCVEEEVELDAGMSIPGTAGAELDSVFWNWGDGTSQSSSAMDGLVQTHAYAEPGTYNVSVVVKDVLNCSSEQSDATMLHICLNAELTIVGVGEHVKLGLQKRQETCFWNAIAFLIEHPILSPPSLVLASITWEFTGPVFDSSVAEVIAGSLIGAALCTGVFNNEICRHG